MTPRILSIAWLEGKGDYRRASSRRNFGNNGTAAKRLTELKNAGFLKATDSWGDTFKITDAGRKAYETHTKNGN